MLGFFGEEEMYGGQGGERGKGRGRFLFFMLPCSRASITPPPLQPLVEKTIISPHEF